MWLIFHIPFILCLIFIKQFNLSIFPIISRNSFYISGSYILNSFCDSFSSAGFDIFCRYVSQDVKFCSQCLEHLFKASLHFLACSGLAHTCRYHFRQRYKAFIFFAVFFYKTFGSVCKLFYSVIYTHRQFLSADRADSSKAFRFYRA